MSSAEYTELLALAQIEAIGSDRRDLGLMKCTIRLLRHWGLTGEIDPNDLLPMKVERPEMTDQEMYASLLAHSNRHNGQVNRNPESLADPG